MATRRDWSRQEVETIVDDYLDMLGAELSGEQFNKAQHNAALLPELNARSRGAIEFKHCNISAILQESGRPFINGYKPRSNAQRGLLDDVIDEKWEQFARRYDTRQTNRPSTPKTVAPVPVESTDWLSDIASCIETLDTKFSLADVYSFETQLSSMHPESGSIRPSIRQTLQKLRDRGAITFVDNLGNYAKSDQFPAGIQIIDISSEDSEDPFDDDSDTPDDPNEKYLRSIRKRRGAPRFRRGLLRLYGQRCAITGEGPVDVLEAAPIEPHAVRGRNSADNGLLLRADIHTLFDLGLLKVEPKSMSVQIHPKLRSTYYETLHSTKLRPRADGSTPNLAYLQEKYDQPPRLRL